MRLISRMATTRFPGWCVVWTAFTVCMFGAGVGYYGPSVYLQTLHSSRGWPISTISAAITTHFLLSAAVVAFLPEIHRRFGVAWSTIAGSILVAVGICGWGNARELWQLFPAASLSGAGFALIGGAAINAMVTPWFDRDRPKALSTALNGASIGGRHFCPPLGRTNRSGWIPMGRNRRWRHYGMRPRALGLSVSPVRSR